MERDRGTQAPVDVRGGIRLEGLHPLKHCLRFGGEVLRARTSDRDGLLALAREICPDLVERIDALVEDCAPEDLVGDGRPASVLPSPVVAVARHPGWTVEDLAARADRPVVALERPTHLGNLGAVVRVAAAADAAGVVTTGPSDPWHTRSVRGSAGLHWALPVLGEKAMVDSPPTGGISTILARLGRPIVALHPDGEVDGPVPPGAVLLFGSERTGLSAEALAAADHLVSLPMREGVSSLNLATSVAATLYRVH